MLKDTDLDEEELGCDTGKVDGAGTVTLWLKVGGWRAHRKGGVTTEPLTTGCCVRISIKLL